jgi:peptidyl-dipeptidase Dcp
MEHRDTARPRRFQGNAARFVAGAHRRMALARWGRYGRAHVMRLRSVARSLPLLPLIPLIGVACTRVPDTAPTTTAQEPGAALAEPAEENALLQPWEGPHGGVPAFDRMDLADLEPAIDRAIELHLGELDAIVRDSSPPTFDNTIVAMERSGEAMRRVEAYYGIWSSNMSTPEFRAIDERIAPKLSDYESKITQNAALFARIEAVWTSSELKARSPADQRLVKLVYEKLEREGAKLTGDAKARYAAIQRELAELHTAFGNNVLADEEGYVLFLEENQLGGLPDSVKAAAAAAAESRGQKGKYAITNTRSSMDPFLTYSDDRALREKVWRTYYSRGDNGDAHDNKAIIAKILALRDERVALLGQENYATWRLGDRMAKTPDRAMGLMEQVWPKAVARAKEEVADMQRLAKREGAKFTIEPWDYRYYADKVRKEKYALDSDEVKHYLQLDKLREAMFMVAGRLFHFRFTPVPAGQVPVFHPDVKVWEVTHEGTGKHVGLWYLDPFARPGKRSGAWASSYRGHTAIDGERTVLASNNSNFVAGAPGKPVLVSWDDATTFFHEFGHALHALSSNVTYDTLNGGVRDYTEFQSQLLERWLSTDEVIQGYLVHDQTGEPMPPELVAKIRRAQAFNQGFGTTEYLASALMDMKLHTVDPEGIDPAKFERDTLAALGMPPQIVMRHRTPHFSHVFSSEGYAAGYYGYLWADVLTADAAEAFQDAPGGFYDEALAKKLVEHLFAPRNGIDPAEAYRAFRGRDATIDALLRDRGFAKARAKKPRG